MTKEQVIDKIKKLLALSTSSNEAEATLAMQRVQELLSNYSLTLEECQRVKIERICYNPTYRLVPGLTEMLPTIACVIAPIFRCISINAQLDTMRLLGTAVDLEVLQYTIEALINQAMPLYREGYTRERSISFGHTFWLAFAYQLRVRYSTLYQDNSAAEKAAGPLIPGRLRDGLSFNSCYYAAGIAAGNSVNINAGVSSRPVKLLS